VSPATPLEATSASGAVGTPIAIQTPRRARQGQHLLLVLVWPDELVRGATVLSAAPDPDSLAGWTELARTSEGAWGTIALFKRAVEADEPPSYEFTFFGGENAPVAAALVLATGIGEVANDVESTALDSDAGPLLITAPSAIADAYSDVCLRAIAVAGELPGELETALLAAELAAEDMSLAIYWQLPEVAGATGTMEIAVAGAVDETIAATFTVQAQPAAVAPQWDDEIAIGLPTVGV
jgi:hypothetical protein